MDKTEEKNQQIIAKDAVCSLESSTFEIILCS